MNEINRLPDYLKALYQFIMSMYEDYERDAAEQDKSFALPCYKESVKQLARAYKLEQIWTMERKMPSFEDFMNNSVPESCIYLILTSQIPGLKSFTKEIIDWLVSEPTIVISTAHMGRHHDNLGSEERENREGKVLTVVDCYMKEHGVSRKEAVSKFHNLVEDGWKTVNKEWVTESSIPKEIMVQLINYIRMAELTYMKSKDNFTFPEKLMNPVIAATFVEPFAV